MRAVVSAALKETIMADFYVKDAAKHSQKLRHLQPETAQELKWQLVWRISTCCAASTRFAMRPDGLEGEQGWRG
jgi:hypothetical protein